CFMYVGNCRARRRLHTPGVLEALEIQFYRLSINLTTIMKEHPFAQFEGISEQVWRDVPLRSDTRNWLRLQIEVKETQSSSGERVGHKVHNIAVWIATGSVTAPRKAL